MRSNEKATKMTKTDKLLCWLAIVLCVLSFIGIILALLPWDELQLDKLDYKDERLALMRACYPFGVPNKDTWKSFRRGQPGYIEWG